jgi:hypothetical protein
MISSAIPIGNQTNERIVTHVTNLRTSDGVTSTIFESFYLTKELKIRTDTDVMQVVAGNVNVSFRHVSHFTRQKQNIRSALCENAILSFAN